MPSGDPLLQADSSVFRGVLELFRKRHRSNNSRRFFRSTPPIPASTPFVDRNGPMLCTQQISIYTIRAFSDPGDAPASGAVLTSADAAVMLRLCGDLLQATASRASGRPGGRSGVVGFGRYGRTANFRKCRQSSLLSASDISSGSKPRAAGAKRPKARPGPA